LLTGNLLRASLGKDRIIPHYLNRDDPHWIEVAETLLMVFREGIGLTRGEIASEVDELIGGGGLQTVTQQGLAKVLEDRAEFEVVADIPPDQLREKVFTKAAEARKQLAAADNGTHHRRPFNRDAVLSSVGEELGIPSEQVAATLFADLKAENRLIKFVDLSARELINRYNVALAQAVLLRSTGIDLEIRGEQPERFHQIVRRMKFHRLMYTLKGTMNEGYRFHIDGPVSLFTATTKYGFQIASFLPVILPCSEFRLTAEVRWGPKRVPKLFVLQNSDGLSWPQSEPRSYVPAEVAAFAERFTQIAADWTLDESTELIELGQEGIWFPDYRATHKPTGLDVYIEVLGFWNRASVERLLRLIPAHGPPRVVLAISDRLKVDEGTLGKLPGPVVTFKEIPNAPEILKRLESFLPQLLV
jgi:uncharacterized protein